MTIMIIKSLSQNNPVKIMSVEDSDDDFDLIKYYISDHYNNIKLNRSRTIPEVQAHMNEIDKPDILLLDLIIEGISTIEYITKIKTDFPSMEIIVISGNEDVRIALECIQKGSQYVLKGDKLEIDLVRSLNNAMNLINSRKEVQFLQNLLFKEESYKSVLFKNSNNQAEIVYYKDFDKFPYHIDEPLDTFLLRLYTYISIGIGQGGAYNTGVVLLPSATNYHLLIYSFYLNREGEGKSGLQNPINYYQYVIFVPNHLTQYLPNLQVMEPMYKKQFLKYNSIEEIKGDGEFLTIKRSVLTFLKANFNYTPEK